MAVRTFYPSSETYVDSGFGIVLGNHMGSTLHQDTGREAQVVADYMDVPVVAFERPGSHALFPDKQLAARLSTYRGFAAEMLHLSVAIDKEIDAAGLQSVVLAGHSAGGLGALGLTWAEGIGCQRGVYASEPPGCMSLTVRDGVRQLYTYNKWQSAWQKLLDVEGRTDEIVTPLKSSLGRWQAISRFASMTVHSALDIYHMRNIAVTPAAAILAAGIAESRPDIAAVIEFADESCAAPGQIFERLEVELPLRREAGNAPFIVQRAQAGPNVGTTHASYDNTRFFAEHISRAIMQMNLTEV